MKKVSVTRKTRTVFNNCATPRSSEISVTSEAYNLSDWIGNSANLVFLRTNHCCISTPQQKTHFWNREVILTVLESRIWKRRFSAWMRRSLQCVKHSEKRSVKQRKCMNHRDRKLKNIDFLTMKWSSKHLANQETLRFKSCRKPFWNWKMFRYS